MKCILMNKNTEVLVLEYDQELKIFNDILEVKNIDYAPVILKKSYELGQTFRADLTEWFKGRGIPSWRDDLDLLLAKLNISTQRNYSIKPLDFLYQINTGLNLMILK